MQRISVAFQLRSGKETAGALTSLFDDVLSGYFTPVAAVGRLQTAGGVGDKSDPWRLLTAGALAEYGETSVMPKRDHLWDTLRLGEFPRLLAERIAPSSRWTMVQQTSCCPRLLDWIGGGCVGSYFVEVFGITTLRFAGSRAGAVENVFRVMTPSDGPPSIGGRLVAPLRVEASYFHSNDDAGIVVDAISDVWLAHVMESGGAAPNLAALVERLARFPAILGDTLNFVEAWPPRWDSAEDSAAIWQELSRIGGIEKDGW